MTIGLIFLWLAQVCVGQSNIQRFLSVPDLESAKKSLVIYTGGMIFIKTCSMFMGLLMYAKYEDCDPFSSGKVKKLDQVLPYFVMDIAAKVPGLPGLFVAGIFSAALSTMSSNVLKARQLSKLKRLLTTMHQFALDISPDVSNQIKNLILDLIVSKN